jgi:hypothetical protein
MILDITSFKTDDNTFRVLLDEVVKQRFHTFRVDVLAFENDGDGELETPSCVGILS